MDKVLLQKKLEMLVRCIDRIKSQNVSSPEELESNLDKQEIIILNLQRAVQICIDIGNHILFNAANLAKAVAFRNIAVHQYDALDNKIIFDIINNHLVDFSDFAASIAKA